MRTWLWDLHWEAPLDLVTVVTLTLPGACAGHHIDVSLLHGLGDEIMDMKHSLEKPSIVTFPGDPVAENLHSQCRGLCSITGQGTRFHMPQLKIPYATTKTQCCQINQYLKKKKEHNNRSLHNTRVYSDFEVMTPVWSGTLQCNPQWKCWKC